MCLLKKVKKEKYTKNLQNTKNFRSKKKIYWIKVEGPNQFMGELCLEHLSRHLSASINISLGLILRTLKGGSSIPLSIPTIQSPKDKFQTFWSSKDRLHIPVSQANPVKQLTSKASENHLTFTNAPKVSTQSKWHHSLRTNYKASCLFQQQKLILSV